MPSEQVLAADVPELTWSFMEFQFCHLPAYSFVHPQVSCCVPAHVHLLGDDSMFHVHVLTPFYLQKETDGISLHSCWQTTSEKASKATDWNGSVAWHIFHFHDVWSEVVH